MLDTHDLGSCAEKREGWSPSSCTIYRNLALVYRWIKDVQQTNEKCEVVKIDVRRFIPDEIRIRWSQR